ncbi:hypothetical protein ADK70_34445 [Streptomyces rimosus subsp. pseudoverticillatus]|uniref:saccharopine dehydrogenase NADP-binding domain-containing protein n=1 Tax=Streptomyces rimosus TaxID=1927 RepID=UPI0006B2991F|nr:saccharopine dehydrogenase NADP-binding domain-containing protein [Streptomyces rimosus]KOT78363.1 hypothetical protein ADK70_34445 [Streptomyces rimosus subsp. pseudoverticillatus]
MNGNAVLVLGGYGCVGRTIAGLLLKETQVDVVIAGRDRARAEQAAADLGRASSSSRVTATHADAADRDSLLRAFGDARMAVVTTTTPALIPQVAQAALDCGCDYLDTLVSASTIDDLGGLTNSVARDGRVFITQAGFHPGLPAVLIRHGSRLLDDYEAAIVGVAMNARFERPEQATELIPLIADFKADICRDGTWRKATYRDAVRMDMGGRFGRIKLLPMPMPEIKQVQALYGLRDTGVYISGFNWFVDYLVTPLILLTQRAKKGSAMRPLTRLLVWGINTFSSPYQGVALVNEATGRKNGEKTTVRVVAEHDDAYLFTAIPVVACLKQYLEGGLPAGVWMMGHVVDDEWLLRDMALMGASFRTEQTPPDVGG